jgi:C1A family cysteine protease
MKKLMFVGLCLVLCLSVVQADELQELQKILNATRGSWVADHTSVSHLSAAEQQQMLGLLPGVYNLAILPKESKDNTEVRSTRYVVPHTPIRNQGSCGSCYSFGASASYESYMKIKGQTLDISEQDFMMKAKAIGPYGGCSGLYLDTSMNLLKNKGVADESACPYKAYEAACPSSAVAKHKISSWACTTDLNTIKNALQKYGAVYCGFAVYTDFSYYSGGVYRYTSGSLRGYHAVCIVGYDDSKQAFYVKNSWGTGWGERGYFWIGYDQMKNSVKFGTCFGGSYYITAK